VGSPLRDGEQVSGLSDCGCPGMSSTRPVHGSFVEDIADQKCQRAREALLHLPTIKDPRSPPKVG